MNINHLCYFIAVAKHESITKAADAMHMSQPSITAAIKELEKEFGLRLFNRAGNKIVLTDYGHRFLELAHSLTQEFNDFSKKAKEMSTHEHTNLKVGIPAVLGSFFLKRIIPNFENENPKIQLEIIEVPTILGTQQIHDAMLDLLIGVSDERNYANCSSSLICKTELQVAVSKHHHLSCKKVIEDQMISALPFVILGKGSYTYEAITARFSEQTMNIILRSNQIATIKYMLANSNATTILYREIFENDSDICTIPFENPMYANINVFWRKNSYLTTPMKTFIAYLMK